MDIFTHLPPYISYTFIGLFGLCIGSFLNVVIYRLPIILNNQWTAQAHEFLNTTAPSSPAFSLIKPRSQCPNCSNQIQWFYNIPLISWIYLKGQCAYCQSPISKQYILIEVLTAFFFMLNLFIFGPSIHCVLACIFISIIIILSVIDLKTYLLPDPLTLSLLWIGLLANYFNLFTSLENSLLGAAIAYLSLRSVSFIFYLITKKEGMGFGDFKYLAALCAWTGIENFSMILLIACITGILFSLYRKLFTSLDSREIPFGPSLSVGGLIAFYYSTPALQQLSPLSNLL